MSLKYLSYLVAVIFCSIFLYMQCSYIIKWPPTYCVWTTYCVCQFNILHNEWLQHIWLQHIWLQHIWLTLEIIYYFLSHFAEMKTALFIFPTRIWDKINKKFKFPVSGTIFRVTLRNHSNSTFISNALFNSASVFLNFFMNCAPNVV